MVTKIIKKLDLYAYSLQKWAYVIGVLIKLDVLYFMIKYVKFFDKYIKIWERVSNIIKKIDNELTDNKNM